MLTRAELEADLRKRVFGLEQPGDRAPTLGMEIEFLPLRAEHHAVAPLFGDDDSTLAFVRKLGLALGWREQVTTGDGPWFSTPSGGKLSFEPGGQIEYSSPPFRSANPLLADVFAVATRLQQAAASSSIELLTFGIDPYNDVEAAPLQLTSSRYANMARYFDAIGPAGARMMRQTAAVQVNIGLGPEPIRRWRLLNALAAPVIALFANSRRYAGSDTGHASYRSHVWRETDRARTGFFAGAPDPVGEYLDFALNAPAVLSPFGDRFFRPFREWIAQEANLKDWRAHLTTLFPEVRPKGYFEVRSVDAQPPARFAAVIAFLCGLVFDEVSSKEAERIVAAPATTMLERAGQRGVLDPELFEVCQRLTEIAALGCQRLGEDFLDGVYLESARQVWAALLDTTPVFNDAGGSSARIRLRR